MATATEAKTRQRTSLTVDTKIEIIRLLDAGEKQVIVAAKYGIKQNTVSQIKAERVKLLAEWEAGGGSRTTLKFSMFIDCCAFMPIHFYELVIATMNEIQYSRSYDISIL